MASYQRQVRATERQAELEHWYSLNNQLVSLGSAHEDDFDEVTPPVAPPIEPPSENEIVARHQHEQLSGVAFWKHSARREARARAYEAAAREITEERDKREEERRALQAELDEEWRRLVANDRHAVFEAIEAAFDDNEMPAAYRRPRRRSGAPDENGLAQRADSGTRSDHHPNRAPQP